MSVAMNADLEARLRKAAKDAGGEVPPVPTMTVDLIGPNNLPVRDEETGAVKTKTLKPEPQTLGLLRADPVANAGDVVGLKLGYSHGVELKIRAGSAKATGELLAAAGFDPKSLPYGLGGPRPQGRQAEGAPVEAVLPGAAEAEAEQAKESAKAKKKEK